MQNRTQVKAVIFDFDGMLYVEPELFSSWLAREHKVPKEEMLPFFTKELRICQTGEADMKEVLEKFLKKWKWKSDFDSFTKLWFDHGAIDDRIVETIKELKKKNIKCALITNNERHRVEYITKKYELDQLFDYIVTPYSAGALKPDEKIYKNALELMDLKADEIIFFDNEQASVDAACRAGFNGFLYNAFESFKNKINELINTLT